MSFVRAFILSILLHSLLIFAFVEFQPVVRSYKGEHIRIDISFVKIKKKEVRQKVKKTTKAKNVRKLKRAKRKLIKKSKKPVSRKDPVKKVVAQKGKAEYIAKKEERKIEKENIRDTSSETKGTLEKPAEPVAKKSESLPSHSLPEGFPVRIGDEDVEEEESYGEEYKEENLDKIREIVQSYLSYPVIARRMGWEGTVVVRFVLTHEGEVREADVEKSSGFEVLDKNALEVIKLASKDFPRPSKDVVVVIPVVYRLEE